MSLIKLDRENGSKLRFGGQIRKFKKNESFKKFHKAKRKFCWQKILDISRIFALKIVDNLI